MKEQRIYQLILKHNKREGKVSWEGDIDLMKPHAIIQLSLEKGFVA